MLVTFHVDITGLDQCHLTVREQRSVVKAGMTAGGEYWHKTMLPRHFKKNAGRRYGYKPRSPGWKEQKKKLAKRKSEVEGIGDIPLVFTGTMRDLLQERAFIRAYPTRITIKMIGPPYSAINYKSGRPSLAKEVTAMTDREMQFIAGRITETATAEIEKINKRKAKKRERIA